MSTPRFRSLNDTSSVLLRSRALRRLGLVLLTAMFWSSGVLKLWDIAGTQAEMAHFDLHPPALFAAGTIALQLCGSALVVFGGRWAWVGAGGLGVFTLATIPLAHPFWILGGQAALMEQAIALEHVSVLGGLVLAAILGQTIHGTRDASARR